MCYADTDIYTLPETTEVSAPVFNQPKRHDRPYMKQNIFCKSDGHDKILSFILNSCIEYLTSFQRDVSPYYLPWELFFRSDFFACQ